MTSLPDWRLRTTAKTSPKRTSSAGARAPTCPSVAVTLPEPMLNRRATDRKSPATKATQLDTGRPSLFEQEGHRRAGHFSIKEEGVKLAKFTMKLLQSQEA
jgi:hypothetical protein